MQSSRGLPVSVDSQKFGLPAVAKRLAATHVPLEPSGQAAVPRKHSLKSSFAYGSTVVVDAVVAAGLVVRESCIAVFSRARRLSCSTPLRHFMHTSRPTAGASANPRYAASPRVIATGLAALILFNDMSLPISVPKLLMCCWQVSSALLRHVNTTAPLYGTHVIVEALVKMLYWDKPCSSALQSDSDC